MSFYSFVAVELFKIIAKQAAVPRSVVAASENAGPWQGYPDRRHLENSLFFLQTVGIIARLVRESLW
ncbi:MAG: hypothetical protein A2521_16780 [Deltaproteobacteria bacterium RIFOXYD12_FULL_57_12]|nr:MAG: hypothetical protein A2521_16780 [Deltaproteobacteria bacterium RIFOXYD12_FULL_57_12]